MPPEPEAFVSAAEEHGGLAPETPSPRACRWALPLDGLARPVPITMHGKVQSRHAACEPSPHFANAQPVHARSVAREALTINMPGARPASSPPRPTGLHPPPCTPVPASNRFLTYPHRDPFALFSALGLPPNPTPACGIGTSARVTSSLSAMVDSHA